KELLHGSRQARALCRIVLMRLSHRFYALTASHGPISGLFGPQGGIVLPRGALRLLARLRSPPRRIRPRIRAHRDTRWLGGPTECLIRAAMEVDAFGEPLAHAEILSAICA